MWSATWPTEVKALAQDFMSNNVQVHVGEFDLNINKNITQKVVLVEDEHDKLYK
jgi:ATP-dependent RNA helicase DDX5/DBP2